MKRRKDDEKIKILHFSLYFFKQLKKIWYINIMDTRKKITCKVCNKTYNEYHYIHYHLKSKYHKTRKEQLPKEDYEITGLKSRVSTLEDENETMKDQIEKLEKALLKLNPPIVLDF